MFPQNEPYTYLIAAMRVNSSDSSPTLAQVYGLNISQVCYVTLASIRSHALPMLSFPSQYDAYSSAINAGSFSTFQNLPSGVLPVPQGFGPFMTALQVCQVGGR